MRLSAIHRLAARGVVGLLVGSAVAFVALPLVAIIARVSPATLLEQVGSRVVVEALAVSVITTLVAHAIVLGAGTPLAYVLARSEFRGRSLVIGVLELPIVLPPAVAGIGLLAAFGRAGMLGGTLAAAGISIPFTQAAVVIAVIFVSGPFYLRQAIAAFAEVDGEYLDAARTLGASPVRVCMRVAIPLSLAGLEAGSALALARGFGEFGATIMFAGNMPGVTQTMPLAVYSLMDTNFDAALAASVVLIAIGVAVLITNGIGVRWARSRLT